MAKKKVAKKKTPKAAEIVCVLDRSGSMSAVRTDAIGGFNTFLQEQKKLPGKATMTLALFNTEYDLKYNGVELKDAEELNDISYVPGGATALLDAVGRTIESVAKRLKKKRNKPKVIFAILTDGEENASNEWTKEKLFDLIKEKQDKDNWAFLFLAANQDAIATAVSMAIPAGNAVDYAGTGIGTRTAYATASTLTSSLRSDNNN